MKDFSYIGPRTLDMIRKEREMRGVIQGIKARPIWKDLNFWLNLLAIALALFALSSCVVMHEDDGNGKTATYASLGGKGAYRKGYGVVHNHEQSFRDGAIAAGTMVASYAGIVTTKANAAIEAGAQKASVAKHASDNALKGKAIEANAAAHGAAISAELPVTTALPPPAITP